MDKLIECPGCKVSSKADEWASRTAIVVLGHDDHTGVGNPLIDKDPNFFYICPACDKQVDGNQL